jgi:hypothetical protein
MSLSYNNSILAQTISVSGSNNTSVTGVLTSTSGNFTSSLQVNGTGVSLSGHTHTSSNIIDFNSSVSGLLPVKNITAGSYIDVSSTTGNFTISATGLQPSGNYASATHTHTSSDITNFNSSVSGLVSGVYAPLSGKLSQFASTTSAELFSVISDETGSGTLVFNTNPVFSGSITAPTGNFTSNLQLGSTNLTTNDMLNIINSTNLYLWSNFR